MWHNNMDIEHGNTEYREIVFRDAFEILDFDVTLLGNWGLYYFSCCIFSRLRYFMNEFDDIWGRKKYNLNCVGVECSISVR